MRTIKNMHPEVAIAFRVHVFVVCIPNLLF